MTASDAPLSDEQLAEWRQAVDEGWSLSWEKSRALLDEVERLREENRHIDGHLNSLYGEFAERDETIEYLSGIVAAVTKLHREWRIYDECGHTHTEDEPGVVNALEVGLTCEDAFVKSICFECCTGGSGYQSEDCANNHPAGLCWPCPTYALVHPDPKPEPEGGTDE